MSKFEVIRGVEGCCLALDDTRIAGPKPWGGGTVIHAWETDKTYKVVDEHNRWYDLFGTPDRAARSLAMNCYGATSDACETCVNADCDGTLRNKPVLSAVYDALLEWLREEGE